MDNGSCPACVSYVFRGLTVRMMSSSSWCFGVCSPLPWAVFIRPECATLLGLVIAEEQMPCPLLSCSRSMPMCFCAPLQWDWLTQSRRKLNPWDSGALSLLVSLLATGTRAGTKGVAGAGVLQLDGGRLAPVCHPRVCVQRGCSDPSTRCAVAVEIACAVARQLKHLCFHTAMPRNAQLSSFLSPFFDFADMTALALILLHSVALLRFLGVNPINPKKPSWHCR